MKLPSISFVICTYNDKRLVKRLLDSILIQDYPKDKVEIICVDGGSTDGTLGLLKEYKVKIVKNEKRFPEGKGMGKFQGEKVAKNEIIAFVDQDNKLIGSDWLKEMVFPLIDDDNIFGCHCQNYVDKNDRLTNRYIALTGTDPFASYRSLDGRLGLMKIKLEDKGKYYVYEIDLKDVINAGGNCFLYRKKILDEIDGYSQDVEVLYDLALHGHTKFAIPKKPRTHHLAVQGGFFSFLKKRWKWGLHYAKHGELERKYSWWPKTLKEYIMFSWIIIRNLIFIPGLLIGIKNWIRDKELAWLLHPFGLFFGTGIYILVSFRLFYRMIFLRT